MRTISYELEPEFPQCGAYVPRIAPWILQWRFVCVLVIADDERYLLLRNSLIGRRAHKCNCK
jgi:hypothetical protein